MASFIVSQPVTTLSATTFATPSSPFLVKPRHIPTITKLSRCYKISCKSKDDNDQDSSSVAAGKFDRRNVLIGLGGLYSATILATSPFAFATPVSAPEVTKCGPPPPSAKIMDFKFPPPSTPVRDCLDHTKLGYVHQDAEIPLLNTRPEPRISSVLRKLKKLGKANAAEIPSASSVVFPRKLDSTLRVDVPRPKKSRSKTEKEDEEEVLVIKGIELERDKFVKFDVFINDEDDPVSKPDNTEFAGSFVNVPHKHSSGKKSTVLRLAITDLLEDLEAEDDDSVIVTLVPRFGTDGVTIGGIEIELAS